MREDFPSQNVDSPFEYESFVDVRTASNSQINIGGGIWTLERSIQKIDSMISINNNKISFQTPGQYRRTFQFLPKNSTTRRSLIVVSINLLVFYHECRSLIGYATRYLFCDR